MVVSTSLQLFDSLLIQWKNFPQTEIRFRSFRSCVVWSLFFIMIASLSLQHDGDNGDDGDTSDPKHQPSLSL